MTPSIFILPPKVDASFITNDSKEFCRGRKSFGVTQNVTGRRKGSGPDGIRTRDLLNAIQTRSQLRYRPIWLGEIDYNDSAIKEKENAEPSPSAGEPGEQGEKGSRKYE